MLLKSSHSFSLFFLFALLPASYAHAGVSPQLAVNGTPKRSDVKRPSSNKPCGSGVNIASALDTSTAVPVQPNGDVNVTVLNFNPGADGSRKVTAMVDPTGTGKNFVKMTITVNGDPTPKNTGSQPVVAQLPPGTKCAGGSQKNKCLAQFVTTSGFGNCVVVSQGSDGGNSSTPSGALAASPNVDHDISNRAVEDAAQGGEKKKGEEKKGDNKKKKGNNKKNKKKKNNNKDDVKGSGKDEVAAVNKSSRKGDVKANGGKKKKGLNKVQKKKDEANGEKKGKDKSGDGKKGAGKEKKQKKDSNKKQAGTRAARAILADLDHNLRLAGVVDDLEVDNVAQ